MSAWATISTAAPLICQDDELKGSPDREIYVEVDSTITDQVGLAIWIDNDHAQLSALVMTPETATALAGALLEAVREIDAARVRHEAWLVARQKAELESIRGMSPLEHIRYAQPSTVIPPAFGGPNEVP